MEIEENNVNQEALQDMEHEGVADQNEHATEISGNDAQTHSDHDQEENKINFGQLRVKYQERGRKEGRDEVMQELMNAGIVDQNGNFLQNMQQSQQSQDVQNMAQTENMPNNQAELYKTVKDMHDFQNMQKIGNAGKSEYKDWNDVAKFFYDDAKYDESTSDIVKEISTFNDGHEGLHYLYQNQAELEKLKQYRPQALTGAIRNIMKNMKDKKTREIPADPLPETKGKMSSSAPTKSKYDRMMEAKRYIGI